MQVEVEDGGTKDGGADAVVVTGMSIPADRRMKGRTLNSWWITWSGKTRGSSLKNKHWKRTRRMTTVRMMMMSPIRRCLMLGIDMRGLVVSDGYDSRWEYGQIVVRANAMYVDKLAL